MLSILGRIHPAVLLPPGRIEGDARHFILDGVQDVGKLPIRIVETGDNRGGREPLQKRGESFTARRFRAGRHSRALDAPRFCMEIAAPQYILLVTYFSVKRGPSPRFPIQVQSLVQSRR
jgi:hypothetical protein